MLIALFLFLCGDSGDAAQDALPSGRAIVAKHVEAIGGEAAYRAIKSVRARGRFSIAAQGIGGTVELISARPAKILSRMTLSGIGQIENGYNGSIGWILSPISGPELLTGRQLAEVADDAWFDATLHSPDHVKELTTVGRVEFDGHQAFRVRVVSQTGIEQTEYFDTQSGLLIGSEAVRATPQGQVPTVTIMRDYKKFGAILQATTFIQRAAGFEHIVTLTSCDYDVVDDDAFDPPASVKALVGR